MRNVIVIMDSDVDYANRLSKYMNCRNYMELKTLTCAGIEEYIALSEDYHVHALLIDERSFKDLPHEYRPNCIFVLLEERLSFTELDANIYTILKYTSAQMIVKKVMDGLDVSMATLHSSEVDAQIIGVFSPISRSGKTVFASVLGMESSKREKTLLITFDEYRGILGSSECTDLSDIMYYYKQGKYDWKQLGKGICCAKDLDYIAPVKYPEDLKELTASDLREMLLTISRTGQYTRLIVDFGNFGKQYTEVLGICSKIYMPIIYDCISKLKLEEFESYLDYIGRESLREKIVKINVPFYKLKEHYDLYSLEMTDVAKLARDCIGVSYADE